MNKNGDNRSVTAHNITRSGVVTGNHNIVSTSMKQYTLPPPDKVDVKAELAALQELMSKLNLRERGKFERAMQDAVEESGKSEPDKEGRIVKYAQAADQLLQRLLDFGEHVSKLLPHIAALGSWLGTSGYALLKMVGIAA